MRTIIRLTMFLLLLFGVKAFAVVPEPLKQTIPTGSAEQVEVFLAGLSASLEPQDQRMLEDGLDWLEAWSRSKGGGQMSMDAFRESLVGWTPASIIVHGYTRHKAELQGMIDDVSKRHFEALSAARAAQTEEQRAELNRESERLKGVLDALVVDRDETSKAVTELLAPAEGAAITTP